jgi:hypothetical protein
MSLLIDNPIAYAQFNIRGGWKASWTTAAVYAACLIGLIMMTVRLSYRASSALNGWTVGLLIIQGALLLFFGASRVSASIRRDITQRMIESHQLMPVGGFTAIFGYILGSAAQAMLMAVVTGFISLFVSNKAGFPITDALAAQLYVWFFAVCAWFVTAFLAMLMKGGFGLLIGVCMASLMSGGMLVALLPAFVVLVGPVMRGTIMTKAASFNVVPMDLMASTMAQLFLAGVCFIGAARKYRRGEDAALGPMLGLALLAGWVAMSVYGMTQWESLRVSNFMFRGDSPTYAQLVASLVSCMLLSLVPLSSNAWAVAEWRRHRDEQDPRPMRRPMPTLLIAAIAAGLTMLICGGPQVALFLDPTAKRVSATAVVVVGFLVGMTFLLRWAYAAVPKALLIGGIWVVAINLLPLLAEWIVQAGRDWPNDYTPTLTSISPVGLLVVAWDVDHQYDLRVGVIAQLLINAIPIVVYIWSRPGAKRARANALQA